MTLADFLQARVAEDEVIARGAIAHGEGSLNWADEGDPTDAHIARWDPARVLAECEARRAIVELHKPDDLLPMKLRCTVCLSDREMWSEDWIGDDWPCPTLRLLAAVYRDHPDYQESWRPK